MRSSIRAFWFQTRQCNQSWPHHISIGAAMALVVAGWSSRGWAQEAKDILWYGNSFTNAVCCGSTRSVPSVVADVAVAADQVAPRNRNASADGRSLEWHRTNNTAVISSGIAAGQQWEHVVLQDTSTQPTHIGNLALHRSSTVAMYNLVAAHSPAVVPVTYETWARGPGYSFYTGASPIFPGGPAQMQAEVRQGYQLSTADINAAAGMDVARLARVGDAWEHAGFPLSLYASDIFHAQNRGTLLNALVLYGAIYEDATTVDINLGSVLTTLGLSAQDGSLLTTIADAVLGPGEPAAGDYNGDGFVNGLDLAVWGQLFGQVASGLSADDDGDGDVDGADFLAWQRHVDLGSAAGVAAPEPGAAWLAWAGASCFVWRRLR